METIQSKINIACILVTYNRKDSVCKCLDAILSQNQKPVAVYIVDNNSTDGTIDTIKEKGLYNSFVDGIEFYYLLLSENTGGAGGFYWGLKQAFEKHLYDGFWLMDDDGIPDKSCLSNLLTYFPQYDYIAPIVISDEDLVSCSFVEGHIPVNVFAERATDGIIHNYASPFNGVIFSEKLVNIVGFPKKEMFLWGDELNFQYRAAKNGFFPITVLSAVHYHPIDRQQYVEIKPGTFYVLASPDWKLYCLIRNKVYNNVRYGSKNWLHESLSSLYMCWNYYKYFSNRMEKKAVLLLDATISGILGNFSRLNKYRR